MVGPGCFQHLGYFPLLCKHINGCSHFTTSDLQISFICRAKNVELLNQIKFSHFVYDLAYLLKALSK